MKKRWQPAGAENQTKKHPAFLIKAERDPGIVWSLPTRVFGKKRGKTLDTQRFK